MERKTADYIRKYALLSPGDRVICALSGGCDSVCLLLLLSGLRESLQLAEVLALHIHHGIRGEEADRDEAFCRELCARLRVPLTVRHEDIPAQAETSGETLEEAGRRRRMEIFAEETGRHHAVIAAAHHLNDQAETVLMNLCRGSGPSGLAGMRQKRTDSRGFTLIRPLLWAEREEIEAFVRRSGTGWCEDSTNFSGDNTRSRLRQEVLPQLEEIFPRAARHMAALAEKTAAQEACLQTLTEEAFSLSSCGGSLELSALRRQTPLIRQRVLALWLKENGGSKDIGESHFKALESLLDGQSGRFTSLPGGRCVLRDQLGLHMLPAEKVACLPKDPLEGLERSFSVRLMPAEECTAIPKKKYTKWLDYDTITEPLRFRTRRRGDYLILPGGGRQSLQDFFVNEKIPLSQRDHIPLAASGAHVLWVVGSRISAAAKISGKTKTVIEIQYGGDHEETSSGSPDQQ